MVRMIARRLAVFAASLLGASVLIFVACQALPGDQAAILLGTSATPESIAAKNHQLGLDRPLVVRYLEWVAGMLHGDLGRSFASGDAVTSLIAPTLPVTFWLSSAALALAVIIALPLGGLAALRRRHPDGVAVSALAQVGMAVPAFWAGILLSLLFGVRLRVLPPNGYVDFGASPVEWARHLVLPVVSLALVQSAVLIRYVRSAFVEVLGEDFYRTARAVGWRRVPALLRHGVRNASLSLVTVVGLQFASVLVGAVVIEQVFVLPGLGALLVRYALNKDVMVVEGVVMLLVVLVLVINTLTDVAFVLIDPRLRTDAEP